MSHFRGGSNVICTDSEFHLPIFQSSHGGVLSDSSRPRTQLPQLPSRVTATVVVLALCAVWGGLLLRVHLGSMILGVADLPQMLLRSMLDRCCCKPVFSIVFDRQ